MPAPVLALRVEKGRAAPEEIAAITAVVLARAAARSTSESTPEPAKASWRRLERLYGFPAPHSWRH
ncbi:acyl-CoA carboxylase epsilon subunit [Streptomyces sp. NPDC057074]|uniref:acyl-CoA carboxylase epsilon subunit n=1 Tax=Streptomyces sp. NPDC057074 TaxID=3346015 RepID=UPI0036423A93